MQVSRPCSTTHVSGAMFTEMCLHSSYVCHDMSSPASRQSYLPLLHDFLDQAVERDDIEMIHISDEESWEMLDETTD